MITISQKSTHTTSRTTGSSTNGSTAPSASKSASRAGATSAKPGSEGTELPFVTVVVPTRDRSGLLFRCLTKGLFLQTYPRDRWEIVIIVDGSTDGTVKMIDAVARIAPVPIRIFQRGGEGAAAARNLGTQQARGTIVAHIDDDGCPVPEWLTAGVAAFTPGTGIVTGPIQPNPEQTIPFFSHVSEMASDRGIYPTSNIFYRRNLFLEAGGFDEQLGGNLLGRPAFGWDTDLAWKIKRKGHEARFAPEAITYDYVFSLAPRDWLKEPWKAHLLPNVVRLAPEARNGIFTAWPFFDRYHMLWVLSLLGCLLTPRTRWASLLVLPWLARTAQDVRYDLKQPKRWPNAAAKIALLWARQAVLFVSLIYGAIKYKRFVL